MIICFKKAKELTSSGTPYWTAFLQGQDHICGTGETPDEALGHLVFNQTQLFDINYLNWLHRPPNSSVPPIREYPEGKQNTLSQETIDFVKNKGK